MPDILFLPLDGIANAPADAFPPTTADDGSDAADAVRASHDGRAGALAGRWDAAAASFLASAALRNALVARGAAAPAVAVRGWSDVAVCAAARDDAVGAADALARARAAGGAGCASTEAALAEVAAWLDGLARREAPTAEPWEVPAPTVEAQDLLAELATALESTLAVAPAATAPASDTRVVPDVAGAAPTGVASAGVAPAAADAAEGEAPNREAPNCDVPNGGAPDGEWADTEWAPWATDVVPAPDVAAVPARVPPAPEPTADGASGAPSATELPWLELEAPLRPWERTGDDAAAGTGAASVVGAACAVPVRAAPLAAPLAPPLAPALRNAKVDEAVALATAAPGPRAGRLGSLFRRLRRA